MDSAVRKHAFARGVAGLEAEFRIGGRRGGKFVPGVSEKAFEAVRAAVSSSEAFARLEPSVTTDYYFANRKGRLGNGVWTTKDVLVVDDVDAGASVGVRGAVAIESTHAPPPDANPRSSAFFRKKSRESFAWKVLPWRVDLTRVETNEDPDAENETFEIEVELDPTAIYYAPLEHLLLHGRSIATDLARIADG